MQHRFIIRTSASELLPPALEQNRFRLGPTEINRDLHDAEQLPGGDPAGLPHSAGEHGELESGGLFGEAAEGGGIEVEGFGGGEGVRGRGIVVLGKGGGAEREKGSLGREIAEFQLGVAWGRGRVNSRTGGFRGGGEFQR